MSNSDESSLLSRRWNSNLIQNDETATTLFKSGSKLTVCDNSCPAECPPPPRRRSGCCSRLCEISEKNEFAKRIQIAAASPILARIFIIENVNIRITHTRTRTFYAPSMP